MLPIRVRSRAGSWILVVLGALYAVAAIILLAIYVVQTWNGRGLVDYVLQFALVASVFGGVMFIKIGRASLAPPPPPPHSRPHRRPEQESADVRPPGDADRLLRSGGSG